MRQISRLSLRDLLYVLFRDRWILIGCMAAALLIAGGWLFVVADTVYVAESRVLVRLGREKLTGVETMNRENTNFLFQERGQDINNTIELVRDPQFIYPVMDALAAELAPVGPSDPDSVVARVKQVIAQGLDLLAAPLEWLGLGSKVPPDEALAQVLRKSLVVEAMEDTDVMKVTFAWPDPVFAAKAVNIAVESLLTRQARVYASNAPARFYAEQLAEHEQKLKEAELRLSEFRSRNNITHIPLQKESLLREVNDLEMRQKEVQLRLADFQALNQWLLQQPKVASASIDPSSWPVTPEVRGKPILDLSSLDRQYFELADRRAQLGERLLEAAPELLQLDQRIRALRAQKLSTLDAHIGAALKIDGRESASLGTMLLVRRGRLEALNSSSPEEAALERTRLTAEQSMQAVLRKKEELRVGALLDERQISGLRVMSPAKPPSAPALPRKGLILGLALGIALLLGLAYVAIREYFDHSFRGQDDVEAILGVRLLLTVPQVRSSD